MEPNVFDARIVICRGCGNECLCRVQDGDMCLRCMHRIERGLPLVAASHRPVEETNEPLRGS